MSVPQECIQWYRCATCNELFSRAPLFYGEAQCSGCRDSNRKRRRVSIFSRTDDENLPPLLSQQQEQQHHKKKEEEKKQQQQQHSEGETEPEEEAALPALEHHLKEHVAEADGSEEDKEEDGEEDELFACVICGEQLPLLKDKMAQTLHLTSCLQKAEQRATMLSQVLSGQEEDESVKSTLCDEIFHCFVCDLDLSRRALLSRCRHLKACAREHGVSTKELINHIAPIREHFEDDEDEDEEDKEDKEEEEEEEEEVQVLQPAGEREVPAPVAPVPAPAPGLARPNAFTVLMSRAAAAAAMEGGFGPGKNAQKKTSKPASAAAAGGAAAAAASVASKGKVKGKGRGFFSSRGPPGQRAAPSFTPGYKRLQLGSMQKPILVDAFQYSSEGCDCYFLSHFHADHYMGLDCHWNFGTIFCTSTTAGLVRQRLRPKCNIVIMDLDVEYPLTVGGQTVKVTLLDANHCPGSCCMLFSFPEVGRRVLHTGDFRFDAAELSRRSPTWRALIDGGSAAIAAGRNSQSNLCVYLDTTYCEPSHRFPSQRDAVEAVCRHVGSCPGVDFESGLAQQQTLLVFGAYQIGKERVYMTVADLFTPPAKIHVDKHRRKGMLIYQWPVSTLARLTTEASEAFIHVVPMNHISFAKLHERLSSFKGRYKRVLAVQPTGWVYKDKDKDKDSGAGAAGGAGGSGGEACVKLQVRSRGDVTIVSTPYSEHSSFPELVDFMARVRPSSVVPTVNTKKDQVLAQLKALNDAAAPPPHLRRA